MTRLPPGSRRFPYTTLFRSSARHVFVAPVEGVVVGNPRREGGPPGPLPTRAVVSLQPRTAGAMPERVRSEEHTSELQSQSNLVCRLLLEKKKSITNINAT